MYAIQICSLWQILFLNHKQHYVRRPKKAALPLRRSPRKATPVKATPVKATPLKATTPNKKKKKPKAKAKPLKKKDRQIRFTCAELVQTFPPPKKKRNEIFQKNEEVYERHRKYKSATNPHMVGETMGHIVDPNYGTKVLCRFYGSDHDEEVSRTNLLRVGNSLDAATIVGNLKYTYLRPSEQGAGECHRKQFRRQWF